MFRPSIEKGSGMLQNQIVCIWYAGIRYDIGMRAV